jgi:hypothetical protein
MEEFAWEINHVVQSNDYYEAQKLLAPLIKVNDTIEYRQLKFDMLISALRYPESHAFEILTETDDIHVVESLFAAMNYKIFRSLHACLSTIKNMAVLEYVLTHKRSPLNIAYKSYSALRVAVLNMDVSRVAVFISCCKHLDVHVRGTTTMGKSAVEIAVTFGYVFILLMFIENGITCTHETNSPSTNLYIKVLQRDYCFTQLNKISTLTNLVLSDNRQNRMINEELFQYGASDLMTLAKTSDVVSQVYDIAKSIKKS